MCDVSNPGDATLISVLAYSGLRPGEALGGPPRANARDTTVCVCRRPRPLERGTPPTHICRCFVAWQAASVAGRAATVRSRAGSCVLLTVPIPSGYVARPWRGPRRVRSAARPLPFAASLTFDRPSADFGRFRRTGLQRPTSALRLESSCTCQRQRWPVLAARLHHRVNLTCLIPNSG
jgi:hypothetical protein